MKIKHITSFLVLVVSSPGAWAEDPVSIQIQSLLQAVETAPCVFIRNGKSHSAEEGARHMERKYRHFKEDIRNLEEFIELAGTRSTMTGRAYEVVCGEVKVDSATWLQATEASLSS